VNSSVAALLVSHDGARWLPAVIEGLAEQRVPVDAVVAVDTTSRDESTELLREAFGTVVEAHGSTSFPDAVTHGLEHVGDCEWVWLLHDDSRPAPGALEALLSEAEAQPDVDILGPKLREWPSLRRLLELGVTISGTGRRETGL
jgi:GT2 family glycosyltransferase